VLFLNKKDLFKKKIARTPLSLCFKSYTGPQHDFEECIKYIKKRFVDAHEKHVERLRQLPAPEGYGRDVFPSVFVHITCATDTEGFHFVVAAIQAIFLKEGLANSGLSVSYLF
jgi:hypothetical protein